MTALGAPLSAQISCSHLAGKRDAEGLSAEDPLLGQRHQRGLDGHGELHRELRGDHAGDDHHTVEDELEAVARGVHEAVLEHIVRGRQGKAQQEQDEDAGLKAVGRHALRREEDGAHELPLAGLKPGAEDDGKAASVGRPEEGDEVIGQRSGAAGHSPFYTYLMRAPALSAVCCRRRVPLNRMWFLSCFMSRRSLGSSSMMETWRKGNRKDDSLSSASVPSSLRPSCSHYLPLRCGLSGEDGLLDDAAPGQHEAVRRHHLLLTGRTLKKGVRRSQDTIEGGVGELG